MSPPAGRLFLASAKNLGVPVTNNKNTVFRFAAAGNILPGGFVMHPLKLTVKAFGPFKDTEVIDFTKINQKGLYLISGDTGAGKTTILDAIVFALYGSPVSSVRSAEMLRNASVAPTEKTYAELAFEYNGKEYTVRRSLKYFKPNRKNGFTEEKASDELILPDGRSVTGHKNVNEEVARIIGLGKDNFIKVAILAQGRFMDMLFASTSDKTDIFRSIFRTEKYDILQERISKDFKAVQTDYKAANDKVLGYFSNIVCSEDYAERINCASNYSEKLAAAKEITEADKRSLDELEKKFGKNEELRTLLVKKIERVQTAANLSKALDEKKAGIASLKKALPELEAAFREAEKNYPSAEALGSEIAVETSKLENFDKLAEYINSAEKNLADYNNAVKNNEKEKVLAEKSRKDSEKCSAEYEEKKKNAEKRVELETEVSAKKIRKDNLEALIRNVKEYVQLVKNQEKLKSNYIEKSDALKLKREEFARLEDEFLESQSGFIASKLEAGKPCPVCGSTEHPRPAVLHDGNVTKETLDSEKQKLEELRAAADSAANSLSAVSGSIKTKEESIIKTSGELLGENSIPHKEKLDNEYALAEKEYKNLSDKAKNAAEDESRCRELEKLRQKYDLDANSHDMKAKESEKQAAVYKANSESNKAAAAELKKSLTSESREKAEEKIAVLKARRKKIEDEYNAAKDSLGNNRSETDKAADSVKTLENQLKDFSDCTDCNIDELSKQQEESENKKRELNEKITELRDRIRDNEITCSKISKGIHDIDTAERHYAVIKPLYDAACGCSAGKITLEAYIQAEYLENITILANRRLSVMTGGRYELKRTDEKGSAKAKTAGLELNVTDKWNNTERSVKSLSGGEAFEAALALALGFSDAICSESGGVSLRSMFVDEGFGSLDDNSCSQAVNILQNLSQSGGRTVGIISHVAALKNELTDCINVKKDRLSGTSHISC